MSSPLVLKNATLILPDRVLPTTDVLVKDGHIAAIDPDSTGADKVVDLTGQYLMPGIVDLHCDGIEKDIAPRARTLFPLDLAAYCSDRKNSLAGITTAYHCISFAEKELGVRCNDAAYKIVRTLAQHRQKMTVDNRIHVRYEITDIPAVPIVEELLAEGCIDMLSFMDHTPGQGQFHDAEKFATYMKLNYNLDEASIAEMIDKKEEKGAGAWQRISRLAKAGFEYGVPLVSHDDDTPEKVSAMADLNITISEFPVTIAAAKACKEKGIMTLFGAPNLLRGQSQAGNIRVIDALEEGCVDALCADYYPNALLTSVFALAESSERDLAECVRMVTAVPAEAAGLKDRGRLEEGKLADLIAVKTVEGNDERQWPIVTQMWRSGRCVLAIS